MTRKLMLGIFLALLLLSPSQLLAGEGPSPGPTIAKLGAVPSDCGYLKKDKATTSPGLRPDVLIDKPNRTIDQHGVECWEECYGAFGHRWCFTVCGEWLTPPGAVR